MESAQKQIGSPFGRQPELVTVRLQGAISDVDYWYSQLCQRAEFKGDAAGKYKGEFVDDVYQRTFTIYPRAVND